MASLITRTAAELECLLLEKLPGEIRNRIYELALPANSAILVSLQSKNLNTCQIKYDAGTHDFLPRIVG